MEINRAGAEPSSKGPPEWFTSIQEDLDEKAIKWMEKVSDEQYRDAHLA